MIGKQPIEGPLSHSSIAILRFCENLPYAIVDGETNGRGSRLALCQAVIVGDGGWRALACLLLAPSVGTGGQNSVSSPA
jgi:hypothetical protein